LIRQSPSNAGSAWSSCVVDADRDGVGGVTARSNANQPTKEDGGSVVRTHSQRRVVYAFGGTAASTSSAATPAPTRRSIRGSTLPRWSTRISDDGAERRARRRRPATPQPRTAVVGAPLGRAPWRLC
jgi:hypothetical protein